MVRKRVTESETVAAENPNVHCESVESETVAAENTQCALRKDAQLSANEVGVGAIARNARRSMDAASMDGAIARNASRRMDGCRMQTASEMKKPEAFCGRRPGS